MEKSASLIVPQPLLRQEASFSSWLIAAFERLFFLEPSCWRVEKLLKKPEVEWLVETINGARSQEFRFCILQLEWKVFGADSLRFNYLGKSETTGPATDL